LDFCLAEFFVAIIQQIVVELLLKQLFFTAWGSISMHTISF